MTAPPLPRVGFGGSPRCVGVPFLCEDTAPLSPCHSAVRRVRRVRGSCPGVPLRDRTVVTVWIFPRSYRVTFRSTTGPLLVIVLVL